MGFAERDGVRLHVEEAGGGQPLLVISGTGGDLRNRPNPLDWPLVEHFRVVTYDQRGLGQSDQPAGRYTMADYGDDAAAVLDEFGVDQAAVLGVSFGGMVAQELALRHPHRVTRMVLACTSSGGEGRPSFPLHELIDLDEDERARRQLALTDTRWDDAFRTEHPERFDKILASFRRPAPDDGVRKQLEARRHHDTWARLPAIACPVLVCAGRFDGIAPLANSEALADRIPDAELQVFEGGHLFMAQDPDAFPAMIAFLSAS